MKGKIGIQLIRGKERKEQKRKRLGQPRQASVAQRKKGGLSLYFLELLDPG